MSYLSQGKGVLSTIVRYRYVGLLSVLLLVCASGVAAGITEPVRVDQGLLSGTPGKDPDVRVFKGVPYGAPPVGELRWRPTQPALAWEGVRAADTFSPACTQLPREPGSFYQVEFQPQPLPTDEDCLYLNIWTAARSADERRPVMVWLYAGGFSWGSGSDAAVDGEALARKGVVLITLNYRVGALGFLAHPELTAESGRGASGNYGLHDQIAALRWIKGNIAAFGGDPGNVTVFGLSAGAISTNILVASPLAKGLFQRGIAQSGSVFSMHGHLSLADAEQAGLRYASLLGRQSLSALRAAPAEELLKTPLRAWPVVDGWVLPTDVYTIFKEGRQNDVPMLIGGTANEASTLPGGTTTVEKLRQWARQLYGERSEEFLDLYPHATDHQAWDAMVGSMTEWVHWAARAWARMQAGTGTSPVYIYSFERVPPGRRSEVYGAFHMSDIVYAFGNLQATDRPWTSVDRHIAQVMSSAWVRFAKTGDPNGADLPLWPVYDLQRDRVMVFGEKIGSRVGGRDRKALRFYDSDLEISRGYLRLAP